MSNYEYYTNALEYFWRDTYYVEAKFVEALVGGYAYIASHRFEDVSSGSSVQVALVNEDTGRNVNIVTLDVVSTGRLRVDLYHGGEIITNGSLFNVFSLNTTTNVESILKIYHSGSYDLSGADLIAQDIVPGGGKRNTVGSEITIGRSIKFSDVGTPLILDIVNKSTASEDIAVKVVWWEEPVE